MNTAEQAEMSPIVRRFIEQAGNMTQSIGVGRVLGQVYAYLFLSPSPRNLQHMQAALGISKGSASMCVRQLEQWGAARKVWVKGDRKDYYEAHDGFGRIFRQAITETAAQRLRSYAALLDEMEAELAVSPQAGEDGEFIRGRVQKLRAFQKRTEKMWFSPIVQRLLQ